MNESTINLPAAPAWLNPDVVKPELLGMIRAATLEMLEVAERIVLSAETIIGPALAEYRIAEEGMGAPSEVLDAIDEWSGFRQLFGLCTATGTFLAEWTDKPASPDRQAVLDAFKDTLDRVPLD
jgi:hypothetical protein